MRKEGLHFRVNNSVLKTETKGRLPPHMPMPSMWQWLPGLLVRKYSAAVFRLLRAQGSEVLISSQCGK